MDRGFWCPCPESRVYGLLRATEGLQQGRGMAGRCLRTEACSKQANACSRGLFTPLPGNSAWFAAVRVPREGKCLIANRPSCSRTGSLWNLTGTSAWILMTKDLQNVRYVADYIVLLSTHSN